MCLFFVFVAEQRDKTIKGTTVTLDGAYVVVAPLIIVIAGDRVCVCVVCAVVADVV